MLLRLHKYMAECGVGARRKCEALIAGGRIVVDGAVVTEMGVKIDPSVNRVELDGRLLTAAEKIYIALNKPTGVITSADDQFGRPTVLELVNHESRLFPVGRLDYDTSGLIFLTNDGDFAYRLTHPKHNIEKEYIALVSGSPSEAALYKLRNGLLLEDGPTHPAKVTRVDAGVNNVSTIRITISEGRNRQVRRMFDAVGHGVLSLQRVSVGGIGIGELKIGEYRHLTARETGRLMEV